MEKLKRFMFLDEKGREIPNPNPLEIPAGFKRPDTLAEQVRRLVKSSLLAEQAQDQGFETFEESEDFEIDDDMFDPSSPYEEVFDPVLGRGITLDEFRRNDKEYEKRFIQADAAAYKAMEKSNALRARPKRQENGFNPAKKSSRAASERASSKRQRVEEQDPDDEE